MASEQPFQMFFESFGSIPPAHAPSVNRQAYQRLASVLSVPLDHPGHGILLRAPRAGYGKTHLLSALQQEFPGHEFLAVQGEGLERGATALTEQVLLRWVRPLAAERGLSAFDLIARRLFALALQPLVESGEVPSQDREGALAALRDRPVQTFDFHHPHAIMARWARDCFGLVGPRLAAVLSGRAALPPQEVSFWVEVLFHYASSPIQSQARVGNLLQAVCGSAGEHLATARLATLLGLLSLLSRIVIVADDLDGWYQEPAAASKGALLLSSVRQTASRVDVILSLNQEVWESAFVPRMTSGMQDRLTELVIDLQPISEQEVVDLLESRVPGLGKEARQWIEIGGGRRYPRAVLQEAAVAWSQSSSSLVKSYAAPLADDSAAGVAAFSSPFQVASAPEQPAPKEEGAEFPPISSSEEPNAAPAASPATGETDAKSPLPFVAADSDAQEASQPVIASPFAPAEAVSSPFKAIDGGKEGVGKLDALPGKLRGRA